MVSACVNGAIDNHSRIAAKWEINFVLGCMDSIRPSYLVSAGKPHFTTGLSHLMVSASKLNATKRNTHVAAFSTFRTSFQGCFNLLLDVLAPADYINMNDTPLLSAATINTALSRFYSDIPVPSYAKNEHCGHQI